MSPLSQKQIGELSVILSALLWSLFPVVTILTFSRMEPIFTAGLSTLIAALFFAVILTVKRQWKQLLIRKSWKAIFLTTLFIGVLFYVLFSLGLKRTTAGNASIMSLMEIFFSYLILGVVMKHESLSRRTILGALCMVCGALLILLPKGTGWHAGDFLVILATVFAPFGNKYAQEARQYVSSEVIMFLRSLLSGIALCLLAYFVEPLPSGNTLWMSLGFLAFNGILLLGASKILWIEGISRMPITNAISLGTIGPLFTMIVAYFLLQEPFSVYRFTGLFPIMLGVYLLTRQTAKGSLTQSV